MRVVTLRPTSQPRRTPSELGREHGDHVILTWLPYCGTCRQCLRGRPNICEGQARHKRYLDLLNDNSSRVSAAI
ncbi:MAG: hypothetical protein EXQ69_07535 [Acidimicrobiia bacterium]|nr:hypothetical protein [Acidimicrobiia bacterium]